MSQRALPERYRQARNVDEGYEIQVNCEAHTRKEWLRVTAALHISAPIAVSSFSVVAVDSPDCLDVERLSSRPGDLAFSRRPAVPRG